MLQKVGPELHLRSFDPLTPEAREAFSRAYVAFQTKGWLANRNRALMTIPEETRALVASEQIVAAAEHANHDTILAAVVARHQNAVRTIDDIGTIGAWTYADVAQALNDKFSEIARRFGTMQSGDMYRTYSTNKLVDGERGQLEIEEENGVPKLIRLEIKTSQKITRQGSTRPKLVIGMPLSAFTNTFEDFEYAARVLYADYRAADSEGRGSIVGGLIGEKPSSQQTQLLDLGLRLLAHNMLHWDESRFFYEEDVDPPAIPTGSSLSRLPPGNM